MKPHQHKLFMFMLCPSLGHPIPHTGLLVLSLSRGQPSKGFISSTYLIATPPFFKVQQLQGCPQLSHGDAQENHRENHKCPFSGDGKSGNESRRGKDLPGVPWVEAEAADREGLLGCSRIGTQHPGNPAIPAAPRESCHPCQALPCSTTLMCSV